MIYLASDDIENSFDDGGIPHTNLKFGISCPPPSPEIQNKSSFSIDYSSMIISDPYYS